LVDLKERAWRRGSAERERVVKSAKLVQGLIFVDCEATGPCPGKGVLTEFGAVHFASRQSFHGCLFDARPSGDNPVFSEVVGRGYDAVKVFREFEAWLLTMTGGRCVLVSDNPAYDFQWINYGFHHAIGRNPFGHSGRRIGDFYAGLMDDFGKGHGWKRLRDTEHDHHPVHDAMGNVEAFAKLLAGER
jgi:hypothetical protein